MNYNPARLTQYFLILLLATLSVGCSSSSSTPNEVPDSTGDPDTPLVPGDGETPQVPPIVSDNLSG